jgi:hypothetical protein
VDSATIIAIAGLTTTALVGLGGQPLVVWITSRQQRRDVHRAELRQLYLDAMVFTREVERYLDWARGMGGANIFTWNADVTGRDAIDGRMRLLAPLRVLGEWNTMIDGVEKIEGLLEDRGPHGTDRSIVRQGEPLEEDARSGMYRLRTVLREAARTPTGIDPPANNSLLGMVAQALRRRFR